MPCSLVISPTCRGDRPLDEAVRDGHAEVAAYLRSKGALSRSAAEATPGAKRDQSCQTEPAAHPAAEPAAAEGGGAEGGGREGAVASAKHHGAPSWRRASRRVSLAQQAVARADKAVARCQRVSVVHGSSDELCARGRTLTLPLTLTLTPTLTQP